MCASLARVRQFQDGVRWFQALLLLAALFATGLHVPYHLIVTAQLSALLLSMHIFVHSSRFEAPLDDAGHTLAEGAFSPAFYANASSQLSSYDKPSTSSSIRVTLCATAPSARKKRREARAAPPPHGIHVSRARADVFVTCLRGCHHRYQLVPIGLSLALAAFFKRAQLSGFVELDKVTRQLHAAQATPTMAIASQICTWYDIMDLPMKSWIWVP